MEIISRVSRIHILMAVVVFCVAAIHSQPHKKLNDFENNKLQFEIESSQDTLRVGDSILIYMYLKNIDKDSVIIKTRMAVNRKDEPHDVFFKVINPAGQFLPFLVDVQLPPILSDTDYEIIAPGDWIIKLCQIEHFFDMQHIGQYKIRAIYQNWTSPETMEAWRGSLASNTIILQIQE